MSKVTKRQAERLIGQNIYAMRKDGSIATGKLVSVKGNRLVLASHKSNKGKKVTTKAILPLVLFDLLAIGTLPYWGGGFGGGFGGGYNGGYDSYGGGCCNYGNNGYGPYYQGAPFGYF